MQINIGTLESYSGAVLPSPDMVCETYADAAAMVHSLLLQGATRIVVEVPDPK